MSSYRFKIGEEDGDLWTIVLIVCAGPAKAKYTIWEPEKLTRVQWEKIADGVAGGYDFVGVEHIAVSNSIDIRTNKKGDKIVEFVSGSDTTSARIKIPYGVAFREALRRVLDEAAQKGLPPFND